MSYSLIISDEAAFDISDAFFWYQMIHQKLAFQFELEIENALNNIVLNPKLFQLRYKSVHVHFLKKFPYGIHYVLHKKVIKIVAVFHTRKNPVSWDKRIE